MTEVGLYTMNKQLSLRSYLGGNCMSSSPITSWKPAGSLSYFRSWGKEVTDQKQAPGEWVQLMQGLKHDELSEVGHLRTFVFTLLSFRTVLPLIRCNLKSVKTCQIVAKQAGVYRSQFLWLDQIGLKLTSCSHRSTVVLPENRLM